MEKNPQESTSVGPVGKNLLTFDREGCIITSDIPDFRAGNTLWDYIPEKYHEQIRVIIDSLPEIKRQPIIIDFEVLYHGRYHSRRGEVYYAFEYGYLIRVDDIPPKTNMVDYTDFRGNENFFTVAWNGLILGCKYPEQTISGNPAGSNMLDVALPEYRDHLRESIHIALSKKIEVPVEYGVNINGVIWYKTGTVVQSGANVLFKVRRIAHPSKKSG